MLEKLEGFDYEKIKEKWFIKGGKLTDDEISGLFGLLDAREDRLKAIKALSDMKKCLKSK